MIKEMQILSDILQFQYTSNHNQFSAKNNKKCVEIIYMTWFCKTFKDHLSSVREAN